MFLTGLRGSLTSGFLGLVGLRTAGEYAAARTGDRKAARLEWYDGKIESRAFRKKFLTGDF
jgi:hypothetical protein